MIHMNYQLAESKGLSEERIKLLEVLYKRMHSTLTRPEMFTDSYHKALERVRQIEYTLQYCWGFEENPSMWRYDFYLKGCTCPKTDNEELVGSDMRIYAKDCPYHSTEDTGF